MNIYEKRLALCQFEIKNLAIINRHPSLEVYEKVRSWLYMDEAEVNKWFQLLFTIAASHTRELEYTGAWYPIQERLPEKEDENADGGMRYWVNVVQGGQQFQCIGLFIPAERGGPSWIDGQLHELLVTHWTFLPAAP